MAGLYSASVLLAAVLLAEFVVLPWVVAMPRDVWLMGFAAPPGAVIDNVEINSYGFAGADPRVDKQQGVTRVLLLGASVAFNRRFAERLEEAMQSELERPVQVTGAALRSHTTRSSLLKYDLLKQYSFDYVIIYHGINDIWADNVEASEFRLDYRHLGTWYQRGPWVDHSIIVRMLYNRWYAWHEPDPMRMIFPRTKQRRLARFLSLETFAANMNELLSQIREQGSRSLLLTFAHHIPSNYSKERFVRAKLNYNNPEEYDPCPIELWNAPSYVQRSITRNNRTLARLARQHDVPLIEMAEEISWDIENFGDIVHLSDVGTTRFVGLLARSIRALEEEELLTGDRGSRIEGE